MRTAGEVFRLHIVDSGFTRERLNGNFGILFVLRGGAAAEYGDARRRLAEEDFLFLPAGEQFRAEPEEHALVGIAELDRSVLSRYLPLGGREIRCEPETLSGEIREELRDRLRLIFSCYPSQEGADGALLAARAFELIHRLRTVCAVRDPERGKEQRDDALEELVSRYLHDHYREAVTLTSLAEQTFYSTSFLSRFIKRRFGKNFTQYLTDLRLEEAENRVRTGRTPFLRIATDCGFPNVGAFNRAFRAAYGATPTEYRRRALEAEERFEQPGPELEQAISEFLDQKRARIRSNRRDRRPACRRLRTKQSPAPVLGKNDQLRLCQRPAQRRDAGPDAVSEAGAGLYPRAVLGHLVQGDDAL